MLSNYKFRWTVLAAVLFCFFWLGGFTGPLHAAEQGDFYGSWENKFFLTPDAEDPEDLINYDLSLSLNYSLGGAEFSSTSRFKDDITDKYNPTTPLPYAFYEQQFGADMRVGVFDVSSDLMFYPYFSRSERGADQRMEYWLSDVSLTFAGVTLGTKFLLEYTSDTASGPSFSGGHPFTPGEYGAGAEFSLTGEMSGGMTLDIRNMFGMEEDPLEQLGYEKGSGYDIVFDKDASPEEIERDLSELNYVGTVAELYDIPFACNTLDMETKITSENGFEYTLLELTTESETWPLTVETELVFSTQTKSVSIDPSLDLSWNDINVYLDLSKGNLDAYALQVQGFKLSGISLGPTQVSSITALGGQLYKSIGASDIKLRAQDYIIGPDQPLHYSATGYDQIFSVQAGESAQDCCPGYDFGFDFYFNQDGGGGFFDVAQVTGELGMTFTPGLETGVGMSFTPNGDVKVLCELDVYF
ncbi:MAG: hypothetical protein ACOC82_02410 [Candidatus Bipolaricaulota bacterium]